MADSVTEDKFLFVVSSDARVPKGRNYRRLIRRQAMMKAAAARRKEIISKNQNRRQLPIYLQSTEGPKDVAQEDNLEPLDAKTQLFSLSDHLSSTGYEAMRIEQDFDLLSLSALTAFSVGRVTARVLACQPSLLPEVLRCQQWSYIQYVPSRIGSSEALDNAVHCVVARVRQCLLKPYEPPTNDILKGYVKAISSLQTALNDEQQYLKSDVLCATELLGIYELLDNTSEEPWKKHTAGAGALIKLRGPTRYETEFERALLMAQMGAIFTEAIINNATSFLDQEPWQMLFTSLACHEKGLTDCSKLVVSLWATISPIPNLFADVQHIICFSQDSDSKVMSKLMYRACEIRSHLWSWRQRFDDTLSEHEDVLDKRFEILGVCLVNVLVLDRLIAAMDPCMGADIEEEAQSLARQVVVLAEAASRVNPRAGLFMEFKLTAARAALATEHEWSLFIRNAQGECSSGPLTKEIFERWCSVKGRSITNGRLGERISL